jgi:hypothetical protein
MAEEYAKQEICMKQVASRAVRIRNPTSLSVVLYACETWSLTLGKGDIREQGAEDNIWT